jgi:hypothetical protein
VALARTNYLFAGSDRGGESAAVLYSLIGAAKLNGIDPEAYLQDVLSRIAEHPINRIEDCCRGISRRNPLNAHLALPETNSTFLSRRPPAYASDTGTQTFFFDFGRLVGNSD